MKTYLAIDLKSYYASAECAARRLDPLTTHLVVADSSRTEKTICLAVSPSLKAYGIPGRARLFEVAQKIREVNVDRLLLAVRNHTALCKDGRPSLGTPSFDAEALKKDPTLEASYLIAPPRMAYYMEVSAKIYSIYLKYIFKKYLKHRKALFICLKKRYNHFRKTGGVPWIRKKKQSAWV